MRRLCLLLALLSVSIPQVRGDAVTPNPKLLQNGVPLGNLTRAEGEDVVYRFSVPPNVESLTFRTRGGKGDVDLFARHMVYPTVNRADFESHNGGNEELIRISKPAAGEWFLLLDAFQSYSGVRLTATYELPRGAVATPIFAPGPGDYAEKAIVRLVSPARGGRIRYTLDGTEPGPNSTLYSRPLTLTADTQIRAKVFNAKGTASTEAKGDFQIKAPTAVTTLANSVAVHHLAGNIGLQHHFKITVPAGTRRLKVHTEGGPGDAQLYLRRGEVPTPRLYDARDLHRGNEASVQVENPVPGDWYIGLRGRINFSGVSLFAYVQTAGVDLIAWQPALNPYISEETFDGTECEVQEGMIESGTHRLLRFGTETRNIGASDLVMPPPEGNPAFEFATCHGHYHFKGFASYRLLDSQGKVAATGKKVSFCLLDIIRWSSDAATTDRFDCSMQGIQSGWGDIYDAGLPGQWIDITNVPAGTYTLEVTMNPDRVLVEDDYTNNTTTLSVVIPAP